MTLKTPSVDKKTTWNSRYFHSNDLHLYDIFI